MNEAEQYLINVRSDVDAALDRLLPKDDVKPEVLHKAMRYSVFAGGRRFRPALCIAACEALSGKREEALASASAIEALHTYTLIHDDLPAMDDDDMRRGKPSSHKAFNEGIAILAGDALLTFAFELLATTNNPMLALELARATGSTGTVGGQVDDLDAKEHAVSQEQLLSIHARKTAALFAASCAMGAIAAQASEDIVEHMRTFGHQLGMAFQLLDDVCDNDPITMNVLKRDEVVALARDFEKKSYDTLAKLPSSGKLHDIAEYTYASFAV